MSVQYMTEKIAAFVTTILHQDYSVAFFKRSQKLGKVIILKTFPIIFVHFILPQRLDRGKKLKLYHNNNIAYMVYF